MKPNPVNRRSKFSFAPVAFVIGVVSIVLVACGGGGSSSSTTATSTSSTTTGTIPPASPPTCSQTVRRGPLQTEASIRAHARGNFRVPASTIESITDVGRRAHTNHLINNNPRPAIPGPSGLVPSQVLTAYNIPSGGGSGAIAVVEAFDYPQALADFNVFSNQFGLPHETSSNATSSSNRVFQVIYANGIEPPVDADWAQETALDAQWAHAIAPNAKIYVVEAASDNLDDLMTAVNVAKSLPNVKQVNMSFGADESGCNYVNYDSYFQQSGVAFFVAAGDSAGDHEFPPGSANVVSVGGTTLSITSNGTWLSETAWNSVSCGPSAFEPRPTFQNGVDTLVGAYRGVCDISAVADPNTGVSVYDSLPDPGSGGGPDVGWIVLGGTSAATPIIAGVANVAGGTRTSSQDQNNRFYAAIGSPNFHDITTGTSGSYSAVSGWDFPTGVGTPNGTGGF